MITCMTEMQHSKFFRRMYYLEWKNTCIFHWISIFNKVLLYEGNVWWQLCMQGWACRAGQKWYCSKSIFECFNKNLKMKLREEKFKLNGRDNFAYVFIFLIEKYTQWKEKIFVIFIQVFVRTLTYGERTVRLTRIRSETVLLLPQRQSAESCNDWVSTQALLGTYRRQNARKIYF